MAKLSMILSPNPLLKQKSVAVEKVDKDLQKFLDDMLETMYYEEGAGLAAVQVGVLKRIFVLDIAKNNENQLKNPQFYINPEIIYTSDDQSVYNEGCLSFPGARALLSRPKAVKIRFLDYDGNLCEEDDDGYKARGFLHENDHLDGITMPDHMSRIKRDVFNRQLIKHVRSLDNK